VGVKLDKLLKENRKAISRQWFEHVVETYPPDTARFLKRQKDRFANPVGQTTAKGLDALLDELISGGTDRETVVSFLDPIIRIRAIQDFSPSKAVDFILSLKAIIRRILKKELKDPAVLSDLLELEQGIDVFCLIGFDIFVACREKIYQLKVNTERNKIYSAFSRAGLIDEAPEDDPGLKAS
jgi:RsbT co-antagonist protein rsbRD N-terminal domain